MLCQNAVHYIELQHITVDSNRSSYSRGGMAFLILTTAKASPGMVMPVDSGASQIAHASHNLLSLPSLDSCYH